MTTQSKQNRRQFLRAVSGAAAFGLFAAAGLGPRPVHAQDKTSDTDWDNLSEAQWRERLTEEEFEILREEGTEPPYSSPLNGETRDGTYVCAGCALPLFSSDTKFESGTGWPSFYEPLPDAVDTKTDYKLILPRTEYHCRRCNGHQGHVFDDGPEPTGQRWCNNGLALDFIPADKGDAG